jgi:GNAT superfamily N-acetyltransferase
MIRPARLPEDKSAILTFIQGLQVFEHAMEPDRRTDATVAEEFYREITSRVQKRKGQILIAELGGQAVGWAVVYPDENDIYVEARERTFAYISELFVVEETRGTGVGRNLIAACESWARDRGITVMLIGVLSGNRRAEAIYRQAGFAPYATQLRKYLL